MGLDYDDLAEQYASHRRIHAPLLQALEALIEQSPGRSALELGAGTGNYLNAIDGMDSIRAIGVDPSSEMLAYARRQGCANIVRGRAECLPFSDRQFGSVYSVDVIHHIKNRRRAAGESFRVLEPGGMVVICTDRAVDIRRRLPLARYFPDIVDIELARYPSEQDILDDLENAGFEAIHRDSVADHFEVVDASPYEQKAFSSLHFVSDHVFNAGLRDLRSDLERGPVAGESHYTLFVARRAM